MIDNITAENLNYYLEKEEPIVGIIDEDFRVGATTKATKELGNVFLTSLTFAKSLSFFNCAFNRGIQIDDVNGEKASGGSRLYFHKCTFKSNVEINKGNIRIISFNDCLFECAIEVYNSETEYLKFEKCKSENKISIEDLTSQKIDFNRSEINRVNISSSIINRVRFGTQFNEFSVSFSKIGHFEHGSNKLNIEKFELDTISSESNDLIIRDIITGLMVLTGIERKTRLIIEKVKILRKLEISNSFMENVTFSNIDLSKVRVEMSKVDIIKTIFNNVLWPNEFYLKEEKVNSVCDRKLYLREIYRQLKMSLKNQGNDIEALKFYSLEVKEHYNLVRLTRNTDKTIYSKSDYWILRLNKWASNFGQSLGRPIKRLFVVHAVFFGILILSYQTNVRLSICNPSWKGFDSGVSLFFETLIPTHRISNPNDCFVIPIISIFMRISSTFFIYHIIKASRKFLGK